MSLGDRVRFGMADLVDGMAISLARSRAWYAREMACGLDERDTSMEVIRCSGEMKFPNYM